MRTKKPRNRNVPNPVARGFPSCYEPSFKRSVILYAEQKGNQETRKRYGIAEETIRRWRKQKKEILGQAEQSIRRSQRRTVGQGGFTDAPEEDPSTPDLDSMPLQQRLSQNHNESIPTQAHQESVLQSLPISPTKLKVTRQGKPLPPPPTPPPAQEVCLKWNSHHINMQSAFPTLLNRGQYVDATLVAEGRTLKCHKMILSSCSPYFEEVLNGIGPLEHPVLFMNSPYWVLESLCAFMYAGEVHIMQDQLTDLLNAASSLKIKGLANSSTNGEPDTLSGPQVKQETRSSSPATASEKTVKEEKDEEPKSLKYDMKASKRKEDRKAKQTSQVVKQKLPEITPKFSGSSKTTVTNVMKGIAKSQPKPLTTRGGQSSRRSESTKRSEKFKSEAVGQKDKDKEKPLLRKGNINDPLDLLQPVYEEIAKMPLRTAPAIVRNAAVGKSKEKGSVSVRRGVNKRMKKRKYDLIEDREESPPPDFQARKGTRSRPQVKIPKFFHFEDSAKDTTDATIVREPHTDQSDPLIGVEVEEIKAEPLDVDENALEVEEGNLVNYMVQDHEMNQEGEEIIGNYDSPLVNIKREPPTKSSISNPFKKAVHSSPVIVDVHTVAEADGGLMTIKKEKVEIVDISKINLNAEEETIIGKSGFDSDSALSNTTQIIISNVQSMAEEDRSKEGDMPVEAAQPHMSQLDNHSHVTDALEALSAEPSTLLPSEPDPLAQTGDQQLQTEEYSAVVNDKPAENLVDTEPMSIEKVGAESPPKVPEGLPVENATLETGASEEVQQQHDDEAMAETDQRDPSESHVEMNSLALPASSNDQHATPEVVSGGSSSLGSLAGKLGMVNLSQNSNADCMSTETITDESVLEQHESILKNPDTTPEQADELLRTEAEAPEEVRAVPFEECDLPSSLEDSVIMAEATEKSSSSTMKMADGLGAEQSDLTLTPLEEWSSHETPVEPMATSQGSSEPVYTEICVSQLQQSFQQLQADASSELSGHNINCRVAVEEAANSKDLFEPVAEKIDKIEAELEECLASTSDMVPVQPLLAKSVPFDDNEDFTRDIEFSSFISKNNYLDYDFVADVEMEVKDDCRVEEKQAIDVAEPQIASSERDYDEFATDVRADEEEAKADIFHDEDRGIGELETGLEFEHNSINQLENNQDFPGCAEDAQQFLAGLDDDIIMDSVARQQQVVSPEKTLEMIVNDLNESLGE